VLVGTVLVTVLQLASARNEPLVIGVRPLEPDPPDSVLAALGRGLARDITAELTRIEGVQVVVSDVAFETIGLETRQAIEQMGIATHALNLLLHRSPRGYATHVELADRQGRLVIDPQAAGEVTGSTLVDMKHAVLSGLARGLDRELRPESASQRAGDAADSGAVRLATLAKEAWFERTPASLRRALAYFDSAIALDSAYAAAWAGRANALNMLGSYDYSGMAPAAAFDSAEHAARRALALDPERADAYAALGLAQANYRWNWDEAEDNYLKALGRGGSDTSAREWYAQFLAARGRFEEAIQQTRAAVQQLPSLPLPRVNLAHVLYYAGAYDSARAGVQQVLERDPGYNRAHVLAALIDLAAGLRLAGAEGRQLEHGALARLEAMRAASPDPEPVLTALLGYARARCGDRAGARTQLQALERAEREVYVSPELKLLVHVGLGEHDAAFEQLERALEIRSSGLIYMNVEALIAPLRKDPRFAALAAQVH
jgi:tetratricopeptide (TPR) repeat protein